MGCKVIYNSTFHDKLSMFLGKYDVSETFTEYTTHIKTNVHKFTDCVLDVDNKYSTYGTLRFRFNVRLNELYSSTTETITACYIVYLVMVAHNIESKSPWSVRSNIEILFRCDELPWRKYLDKDLITLHKEGIVKTKGPAMEDIVRVSNRYGIGTTDDRYMIIEKLYTILNREPTLDEIEGKVILPTFTELECVPAVFTTRSKNPLELIITTGYTDFYNFQRSTSTMSRLATITYVLDNVLSAYKRFHNLVLNPSDIPRFILGRLFRILLVQEPHNVTFDARVFWGRSLRDDISWILNKFYGLDLHVSDLDIIYTTEVLEGEIFNASPLFYKFRLDYNSEFGELTASYVALRRDLDLALTKDLVTGFYSEPENSNLPLTDTATALVIIITWLALYRTNRNRIYKKPQSILVSYGSDDTEYFVSMVEVQKVFDLYQERHRSIRNIERAWATPRAYAVVVLFDIFQYRTELWSEMNIPDNMRFDFIKGLCCRPDINKRHLFAILRYFDARGSMDILNPVGLKPDGLPFLL
ncbi:p62 [Mint vein banding-associated virus]|uniref:p62 n=1 Tax=Mint vein banding-associated virus TaxID=265877 RepID=Q6QCI0_9CLOS|nr:p62 [Mint vein banding-associated virus]AAS57942.1 p62 [Mint vein banding-associated virus]